MLPQEVFLQYSFPLVEALFIDILKSKGIVLKKKYLSNTFCMLGVALIATAVFRDSWIAGTFLGIIFLYLGYKLAKD